VGLRFLIRKKENEYLMISIENIWKRFDANYVLRDVTIELRPGEVTGLLGHNGSGKSTLVKIIAGVYKPDRGRILIDGVALAHRRTARDSESQGVRIVYQDLALIADLSVNEMLHLDEISASGLTKRINWNHYALESQVLLSKYGLNVDLNTPIKDLSSINKSMVAVARAVEGVLSRDMGEGGLLVLDEATVFIPPQERSKLYNLISTCSQRGIHILWITHNLVEAMETTDRLYVLRDGNVVLDGQPTTRCSMDDIVELISGTSQRAVGVETSPDLVVGTQGDEQTNMLGSEVLASQNIGEKTVLRVEDLCSNSLRNVTFTTGTGEVLGFTGLAGSGCEDVIECIYGAKHAEHGTIDILGTRMYLSEVNPYEILKCGVVFIPADRLEESGFSGISTAENMFQPVLGRFVRRMAIRHKDIQQLYRCEAGRAQIVPTNPELEYEKLSGGNQQKLVLQKWLNTSPTIVLAVEPTQGIDVAVQAALVHKFRELRDGGYSIIIATTDYRWLAEVADRIICLREGKITAELYRKEDWISSIVQHL